MFLSGGLYGLLYGGYIFLDAGAQLQLPAQLPQAGGEIGDCLDHFLAAPSGPFCVVEFPALARQGVDLCLECVMLHGQLRRRFDVVLHQIDELALAAAKLPDLVPQ